jgi:hypothetical protein
VSSVRSATAPTTASCLDPTGRALTSAQRLRAARALCP